MRPKASFAVLLLGFALAGAPVSQAAYYEDPRDIDVTGPYTQPGTGMVFPESLRDFKRIDVISYNSERTDESATYLLERDGEPQIAITVYVYPVPADIGSALAQALPQSDLLGTWYMIGQQLFDDEEQSIVEVHRGAQLVDGGDTSYVQRGVTYPGAFSNFRFQEDFFGTVETVDSALYLFPMVGGKWMIKYRITYPDSIDGEGPATAFIHALPWTIRGLK